MMPTPGSHRHGCGQNDVQWSCQSSHLQRTANSVLFRCLRRGHPGIEVALNHTLGRLPEPEPTTDSADEALFSIEKTSD